MKKFKGLLLCLISMIALNAHADNAVMELNLHGDDLYNISGDTLSGTGSLIKGSFSVRGVVNGQNLNVSQDIPVTKAPNATEMIIRGKNAVEVIDVAQGIHGNARAEVKSSIFGKLKSIKIDKDAYLALMGPALKKSGLDFFKLDVSNDQLKVSFDFDASGLDCEVDGREASCSSDIKIKISITSKD